MLALQLTQAILPRYGHKFSPQCFALSQLEPHVLLKDYRQLDWRGIEALLQLSPPLRRCLGLKRVPAFPRCGASRGGGFHGAGRHAGRFVLFGVLRPKVPMPATMSNGRTCSGSNTPAAASRGNRLTGTL